MSLELLQQYNQVLRPYYAQLYRPGIENTAALLDFMAKFCADQSIVDFILEASPESKALLSEFSGDDATILSHFLKVRVFVKFFSAPLMDAIADSWTHAEFEAFSKTLSEKCGLNYSASHVALDRMGQRQLATLLYLQVTRDALAGKSGFAVPEVTGQKVMDLNPNAVSLALFREHQPKELSCVASSPAMLKGIMEMGGTLQQCAPKVSVAKYILSLASDKKFFFDEAGNAYFNRVPVGCDSSNFYLTQTMAMMVKHLKPAAIKFDLNDNTLLGFATAETARTLNKQELPLLVSVPFDTTSVLAENLRTDFAQIALISKFLQFLRSLKKRNYEVHLQFAPDCLSPFLLHCVPAAAAAESSSSSSSN